jgi:hypothetical protein
MAGITARITEKVSVGGRRGFESGRTRSVLLVAFDALEHRRDVD